MMPTTKNVGEAPTSVTNEDKQQTMGVDMLACVWKGKNHVEMKRVPIPDITDDEDVIVRVTGSSVCGSDLHLYHGEIMQMKEGEVLGHECMGIVERCGPKVTAVRPGDRVVAAFNIACGKCRWCTNKLFTACEQGNNSAVMEKLYGQRISGVIGYSHFLGGFSGAQAEYTRILFGNNNLLKVPAHLPDEKVIFLSDVIPTSYHAVVEGQVKEGQTVGVWGLGPIGLSVVQWLRNVINVSRIVAVDNVPERLELAKQRWAVETINTDEVSDVSAKVNELIPTGVDVAIDCAGFRYAKGLMHKVERAIGLETDTSENLNEMIRATRKFGTISIIADYAAYTNHFLIGGIMEKGLRVIGCGQAPIQRYWQTCLEHIDQGRFDPSAILSHRFRLEDTAEIYKQFDAKKKGIIKVFLETKYSNDPAPGFPRVEAIEPTHK